MPYTDTLEPSLVILLKLKPEHKFNAPYADMELPRQVYERTLMEEPNKIKSSTDTLELNLANPYTEHVDPNLLSLLNDKEEPK
jgi:hypothetical protein